MAKKQSTSKVTRISANDDKKPAKTVTKQAVKPAKKPSKTANKDITPKKKRSWGVLGKIGGYFKGAWSELRQVHWPTRKATWSLTGAVLLFSIFFAALITLLDAGFKFLFEQILK